MKPDRTPALAIFGVVFAIAGAGLGYALPDLLDHTQITIWWRLLWATGAALVFVALGLLIAGFALRRTPTGAGWKLESDEVETETDQAPPARWPRFGIRTAFLLTFIAAIAGTAAHYLARASEAIRTDPEYDSDRSEVFTAILMTTAAPILAFVIFAVGWRIARREK